MTQDSYNVTILFRTRNAVKNQLSIRFAHAKNPEEQMRFATSDKILHKNLDYTFRRHYDDPIMYDEQTIMKNLHYNFKGLFITMTVG